MVETRGDRICLHAITAMIDYRRVKLIACATVIEESLPLLPDGLGYELLDFGLHRRPDRLREQLQAAIDRAGQEVETVLLGYGLCSMAVVGLQATNCTLVIPRVDDCIAIFLGSGEAYTEQVRAEPGTYYLTKGWIEVNDTLLDEYQRYVEKYGQERATYLMSVILKNYRRLVYINTGQEDQERHRAYARQVAERFSLRYEEIPGSQRLIEKMIGGPWDDEFAVVPPGEKVTFAVCRPVTQAPPGRIV